MQRVDVVVVNYNTGRLTCDCIASAKKTTTQRVDIQIVVVDNASTDESVQLIKREHPDVKVKSSPNNLGYAGAVNLGMRVTKAELVLVTNSDVLFEDGCIGELVKYLTDDPQAGVVGPQQMFPDGSWQRSYGVVPSLEEGVRDLFFVTSAAHCFRRVMWRMGREEGRTKEVGYVDGAVMAIRREAFMAVGGFDEKFFFFAEESDFCLRVRDAGWKVVFLPSARAIHIRGASSGKEFGVNKNRLNMLVAAKSKLVMKHYGEQRWRLYCILQKLHAKKMRLICGIMRTIPLRTSQERWEARKRLFGNLEVIWNSVLTEKSDGKPCLTDNSSQRSTSDVE